MYCRDIFWIDRATLFSPLDYLAITLLLGAWLGIGWRIENPSSDNRSVAMMMDDFRRDWMREIVTREPRIFDAQDVAAMRQGSTFFASITMIAIGGGLAVVWEIKILIVIFFLANVFLKYVWAHSLFGYCAILMAAVPNDPEDTQAYPRAPQAAEICVTAARSFNRALRAT